MKKRIAIFVTATLAIGIAIYGFENQNVQVLVKSEVRCFAANHRGNRIISKEAEQLIMPRWKASSNKTQVSNRICSDCRERIRRQEREAKIREEKRKEAEEAKTKVPNLLGKGFKEIASLLGEPSSITNDLTFWHWDYRDKLAIGYLMRIHFFDNLHTQGVGYPKRSKQAHSIVLMTTGKGPLIPARQILPAKVLNESPVRIYFYPEANRLILKWLEGESPDWYDVKTGSHHDDSKKLRHFALLKVTGGDVPIYAVKRWLDTNTGDYKQSYKVTADWKDCLVQEFEQSDDCGRMNYTLHEEETERCIRIK